MLIMPTKVPNKGSKGLKKTKKPNATKRTVQLQHMSDSNAPMAVSHYWTWATAN